MNKIIETIKKCGIKVIRHFVYEPRRISYIRLIILGLYLAVSFLITMLFAFGSMLAERVLIVNPSKTHLSEGAVSSISGFLTIGKILFLLFIISFFMVLLKEYQEFQIRKTIKKYKLDVIE